MHFVAGSKEQQMDKLGGVTSKTGYKTYGFCLVPSLLSSLCLCLSEQHIL